MNRKPGRSLPAVLRDDENRVTGKRNRFIADSDNTDIDAVLRSDDNIFAFGGPIGGKSPR